MSMWLSKKKKADLVDLCDELGLRTDGLKKPEIEQNLKQYLYQHESKLSTHPSFSSYYETLARTPNKRGSPQPPVFINPVDPILPEGTKRERRQSTRFQPGRKSTWGYSESVGDSEPEPTVAVVPTTHINGIPEEHTSEPDPQLRRRTGSTTPGPTRRSARIILNHMQSPSAQLLGEPETPASHTIPLPPSPAVVADLVEASTQDIRARISIYLHEHLTPVVTRRLQSTQQSLSNVVSVAVLVHAVELGALVYRLIPATYPVTVPPVASLNPIAVNLPDLFAVLESRFWVPVLTWVVVSVLIPGLVGYFVNLTRGPTALNASGGYVCDPLTFALAKGLLGWILFCQRTVNFEGLRVVEEAVGKEVLAFVGSIVVGLVGLWEGLMSR
ncbi:hypothetical protein L211DRAFT_249550 [Terfezia boudieri ATCC MYA-4762]|uniref:SAP domain-containing protein n=1 Tax=Terfezia boudieri ATCC MYA-4762 TaxID=1051890 RepID=A0A3N4M4S9_9PEZI|nr:hypothetical protein L211DRAFT_249550 [Terfezia boudieri ATCC MYA-4762]